VSKPTVAIVGRPNVGKSTLFNRLLGGRPAIVSERPGTTRDRHFGDAEWQGRRFWLVDTGGLVPDSEDSMDRAIRRQVEFALSEADVIVFLVDGREGLHPLDQAIAERLRKAGRPVLLAVNKLDNLEQSTEQYAFYALGFGDPVGVSAAVGKAAATFWTPWSSASLPMIRPKRKAPSMSRWWVAQTWASPLWSIGFWGRSGTLSRRRRVPRATPSTASCGFRVKHSTS
jgi:small GTP-binding protein